MSVLINDPDLAARFRAAREASESSHHDEVWEGVYVVSPNPDNNHQWLVAKLMTTFANVVDESRGDKVWPGVSLTDRDDWTQNYRVPDLSVILGNNPSADCETHFRGGPDLVVEILSPNEHARDKLGFYAAIGVREMLVIDRKPWALEFYRLDAGELKPAGRSTVEAPDLLLSTVLPLVCRLLPGDPRPRIDIRGTGGQGNWTF